MTDPASAILPLLTFVVADSQQNFLHAGQHVHLGPGVLLLLE